MVVVYNWFINILFWPYRKIVFMIIGVIYTLIKSVRLGAIKSNDAGMMTADKPTMQDVSKMFIESYNEFVNSTKTRYIIAVIVYSLTGILFYGAIVYLLIKKLPGWI